VKSKRFSIFGRFLVCVSFSYLKSALEERGQLCLGIGEEEDLRERRKDRFGWIDNDLEYRYLRPCCTTLAAVGSVKKALFSKDTATLERLIFGLFSFLVREKKVEIKRR
jgi:hypothetical protein